MESNCAFDYFILGEENRIGMPPPRTMAILLDVIGIRSFAESATWYQVHVYVCAGTAYFLPSIQAHRHRTAQKKRLEFRVSWVRVNRAFASALTSAGGIYLCQSFKNMVFNYRCQEGR